MPRRSASHSSETLVYHILIVLSQAAVVRGAALRGLEGTAPRIKYVRRHYGIRVGEVFREGIDPEESAYTSVIDDTKRCGRRLRWLISKVSYQKVA